MTNVCFINVTKFAPFATHKGIFMKDVAAIKSFLKEKRLTVITTHANPDADALGSSLGLYYFLKSIGQDVYIIVPNEYPDFIEWMVKENTVLVYEEKTKESERLLDKAELLFCLDFSSFSRIKGMSEKAASINAKVALIDHHLNPEIEPNFNFWDDKAAATAELVFDFIVNYGEKQKIDNNVAEYLYAGIMTDTGSFRHSSTTSKVLRIAAELVDLGANANKISSLIYDTNSLSRLRFLGHALAEKLIVIEEYRVAYFVIKADDFLKFNLKKGDTEGLVNYALSIKNIVIASIIIERDDEIKLSFRSAGDYAVNKFANEYFDGGGHKNAAGGSSDLSLDETVKKFKSLIEKNILNSKR